MTKGGGREIPSPRKGPCLIPCWIRVMHSGLSDSVMPVVGPGPALVPVCSSCFTHCCSVPIEHTLAPHPGGELLDPKKAVSSHL